MVVAMSIYIHREALQNIYDDKLTFNRDGARESVNMTCVDVYVYSTCTLDEK